MHATPFDQSAYQVRFEWGVAGLRRLARADVVVVVDVLGFSTTVVDAVDAGARVTLAEARGWSDGGAVVADAAAGVDAAAAARAEAGPVVLVGCLRNASAVARAVLAVQDRRQARTSVAVIAAGAPGPRFAVEDQLGAGTIIAALSDLGIDHTSPEAAAAGESARGLRRAMRHLLTASGSGRELAAGVADAAEVDATTAVPVLRDGVFERFA